jgi:hypothetical protein
MSALREQAQTRRNMWQNFGISALRAFLQLVPNSTANLRGFQKRQWEEDQFFEFAHNFVEKEMQDEELKWPNLQQALGSTLRIPSAFEKFLPDIVKRRTFVFSDSLLCLGHQGPEDFPRHWADHPEIHRDFAGEVSWFIRPSGHLPHLFEMLKNAIAADDQARGNPERFSGNIVFMTCLNDVISKGKNIDWRPEIWPSTWGGFLKEASASSALATPTYGTCRQTGTSLLANT